MRRAYESYTSSSLEAQPLLVLSSKIEIFSKTEGIIQAHFKRSLSNDQIFTRVAPDDI